MLQLYVLPWKQTQDFKRICHVLRSYVAGYHLQLAKVFHMLPCPTLILLPEIKKAETNECSCRSFECA